MEIVFICGTLEPGCDGVGDYTIRLAEVLSGVGHKVSILSINDWFVNNSDVNDIVPGLIHEVRTLRVPSTLPEKHRLELSKAWLKQLNPDWVSLQFVPFSFQSKGLPLALGSFLKKLEVGFKWHIMFHELWVGMPKGTSRKHVIWGCLQKQIIKALITKLRPKSIHTPCQLYHAQLIHLGLNVRHLPLFSNIPVKARAYQLQHVESAVPDINCADNWFNSPNFSEISLIIFGTIHPQAQLAKFIELASKFMERHGLKIKLTLVGRCGTCQELWVTSCISAGISVDVKGEQPAETISFLLSNADIGISTSAFAMIDKSGTVAAMLEHKLPVICVGQTWIARDVDTPKFFDGIYALHDGCIEACLSPARPKKPFCAVEAAKKLIKDLEHSDPYGKK